MRSLFTHTWHYYLLALLFFTGLIVFLPDSGYDKYFWVTWAQYIKQHGLLVSYNNPEINYHPVVLLIIKGFTLCVSEVNYTNINWLKVPTALFDWGIIFLALRMLKEQGKSLQWGLLLALNPAFWYNTIIWGQFDSIWVFFSLAALYTATRSSWWVSVLLFVLALNTKLFALVFLPVLYPLWVKDRTNMLHLTRPLLLLVALQLGIIAIFLPFTHSSVVDIVERSTGYYESVSRNAYNVWYFIFADPLNTPDEAILPWAWLTFLSAYAVLGLLAFLGRINHWQVVAIVSLLFFFVLTRMHERYAHAALVFSFIVSILLLKGLRNFSPHNNPHPNPPPKRGGNMDLPSPVGERQGVRLIWLELLPFFLISTAYLLNMEAVMQMLNKSLGFSVDYASIWFNPLLVATLYLIACLLLAYNIIKKPNQLKPL